MFVPKGMRRARKAQRARAEARFPKEEKAEVGIPPRKDVDIGRLTLKEAGLYQLVLETGRYMIFVLLVLGIAHTMAVPDAYHLSNSVENTFLSKLDKINVSLDVYYWMENEVFPKVSADGYTADGQSVLVGAVRMRQVRVPLDTCVFHGGRVSSARLLSLYFDLCAEDYTRGSAVKGHYHPGWTGVPNLTNTSGPWIYRQTDSIWSLYRYDSGGYVIDIDPRPPDHNHHLSELRNMSWIDRQTRAVFVDFTLYNANVDLFNVVSVLVETPAIGRARVQFDLPVLRLHLYNQTTDLVLLTFQIAYVIFLAYFIYYAVRGILKDRIEYFKDVWKVLDLMVVILSLIAVAAFVARMILTENTRKNYRENNSSFLNIALVVLVDRTQLIVVSILAFIGCCRCCKLLRGNNSLYLMQKTFGRVISPMLSHGGVILVLMFSYGMLGNISFGGYVESYSTIYNAFLTVTDFVIGSYQLDDYVMFPTLGTIFFISFVLIMNFVLLNFFATVMMDAFFVEKETFVTPEDREIVTYILNRARVRLSGWCHGQAEKRTNDGVESDPIRTSFGTS
ncbi:PKD2L1 [Branchiostoma lanceolatum]|uniref:PKD2L1 protein n=2 Tax=Branchiostoma lanceolatum TaxID=7740 RepID=A0A8J9ZM03_BRALA|nr:PKD2L1 [Branchiostoma lanceolatum]